MKNGFSMNSFSVKIIISLILCLFIGSTGRLLYLLDPHNQLEFNLRLLLRIPLIVLDTAAAVLLFCVMARPTADTPSSSNSTPAE